MYGIAFIRFREYVADMAAVPTLGTLLNAQTIWLPAIMILAIFILSCLATGPFVQRYPGYPSIPGIYFG